MSEKLPKVLTEEEEGGKMPAEVKPATEPPKETQKGNIVLEEKVFEEEGRKLTRVIYQTPEGEEKERWYESKEFGGGRRGDIKLPGEITIDKEMTEKLYPRGDKEHRVVTFWRPTPDGKNMVHMRRAEEKNETTERWEPLAGTEEILPK